MFFKIYFFFFVLSFDTCAVEAIVFALGGKCLNLENKTYDYFVTDSDTYENHYGFIASVRNHEFFSDDLCRDINNLLSVDCNNKEFEVKVVENRNCVKINHLRCNIFIPTKESNYLYERKAYFRSTLKNF